jgi:hypothetical protein
MDSITIRELKRGRREDALQPGQSLTIRKAGGRTFELRRLDAKPKSRRAAEDQVRKEYPDPCAGGPVINLSGTFREEP